MSLLRTLSDGLRSVFCKERVEKELNEKLNDFLEMAAEEKMRQGMSRKEALRAVRLERGSLLEVTKEVVRSAGWESFVETSWQDLRFGAHSNLCFRALGCIAPGSRATGIMPPGWQIAHAHLVGA